MDDLIEALQIFRKYGNPYWPTYCEHDHLYIIGIDPEEVTKEDELRLEALGFFSDEEMFLSFRFGGA